MHPIVALIIMLVWILGALASAAAERKRRQARMQEHPPQRPRQDPIAEFLQRVRREMAESGFPAAVEERQAEEPEPTPEIEIREIEEPAPAPIARPAEPAVSEAVAPLPIPVATLEVMPPMEAGPGEVSLHAIRLGPDSARDGIIVAEILGPPLAKRRGGARARRLF